MTEVLFVILVTLAVLAFWLPLVVGACVRSATRNYLSTRVGFLLAAKEALSKEMRDEDQEKR